MLDARNARQESASGARNHSAPVSPDLRLLISCQDKKGLVAAVSSFLEHNDGNILRIDQYLKPPPGGRFFMRMEVEGEGFGLGREEFDREFAPLAREYGGAADIRSKQGHFL